MCIPKLSSEWLTRCGAILSLALLFIQPVVHATGKSDDGQQYAEYIIQSLLSGDIVELDKIPETAAFGDFLIELATRKDSSVEEIRQQMIERGVMRYAIDQLREGQISLTEYVNLRPDIHWFEALRMAYVGGGLEISKDTSSILAGKRTDYLASLQAATDIIVEEIAYSSTIDDLYPLYAEVAFDPKVEAAPIIVNMHGDMPGTRMGTIFQSHGYAKKGFFAIAVSLRGRDGSAGEADTFGNEIHDIYDAVEYVKKHYAQYVDSSNVNITGGSAGGMDSIAAAVRFPDYFRYAIPFFGSPDVEAWMRQSGLGGLTYEEWLSLVTTQGLPEGSINLYKNIIRGVGGMPDDAPDRWMARNFVPGAINNPYTQIHMFWDEQDGVAPSITYRNRAYLEAVSDLEYNNIFLHYSERGDRVRYLHWGTPDNLNAQRFFVPQMLAGTHPEPVLADAARLVIPGFVRTKKFFVKLGQGNEAMARLDYSLSERHGEFRFQRLSRDPDIVGELTFSNPDAAAWSVKINREVVQDSVRDTKIRIRFDLNDVVMLTKQ